MRIPSQVQQLVPSRNCPKCQAAARIKWLAERKAELLPVRQYFHVVFAVPQQIAALAPQNGRDIYNILFRAASEGGDNAI